MTATKLDRFTRQYLATALWAEMDNANDQGGEPLDANYTIDDFSPESLEKAIADCAKFQADNAAILEPLDNDDIERAGHDFWLTRNGHGAGFWDGDWPEHGDALDDPKAWRDTLAFPDTMYPNGPSQEAVTAHVEKCLAQDLLKNTVPVLWTSSIDGKEFMQWDSKLRPYADELKAWEAARDAKRATLVKARLEYLRGEIKAERISYGEIAELQSLADHIDKGDVELLEWAGVPEASE